MGTRAKAAQQMIATCEICKTFHVPWDYIGEALMAQHLKDHERERVIKWATDVADD